MSSNNREFLDKAMAYKNVNFNATIERQIKNLLLDYAYRQSFVGQIASLFCATILLIGLYSKESNNQVLFAWYLFFLAVTVTRIIIIHFYNKHNSSANNFKLWRSLFIGGVFLGGLSWAIPATWLFVLANSLQQALIILILSGITAGATPLLAADLIAVIVFLSTILIPFMVQLIFNKQNDLYALFDVALIVYYLYMLVLSRRAYHLFKQTIGLRFEKEELEKMLSTTKGRLSEVSYELDLAETHDILTGLMNRKLFVSKLAEAIKQAEISQMKLALLYINLDNFKFVNDAYGHEVGDKLLKEVVIRIKEILQETNILARGDGDELMIILENQDNYESIVKITAEISQALTKQFVIESHHITISASIGGSVYPVDGITADVLIKKSDSALNYIKEHGRNNFRFSTNLIEIKTP
jgi:diguanylate cyclase (GGDEF)-like protein